MTLDPEPLLGGEALGDELARLRRTVEPQRVVGGWATVELDRAEAEVRSALAALGMARVEPADNEHVLGARCRLLRFEVGDVLLLEPSTEGRLAAGLARYGEGRLATYLIADRLAVERARRAGFALTSPGRGPFGPERLVILGSRWGPFVVLAELGGSTGARR
jgi:hypothetical protein